MIRLGIVLMVIGLIMSACAPTRVVVKQCVDLENDTKLCELIKKL